VLAMTVLLASSSFAEPGDAPTLSSTKESD
jgi:hypothetical protein